MLTAHVSSSPDGRYILKQMSRVEVASLVAFAQSYLCYMMDAIRENVCAFFGFGNLIDAIRESARPFWGLE